MWLFLKNKILSDDFIKKKAGDGFDSCPEKKVKIVVVGLAKNFNFLWSFREW